jgi:hypothetical protein
VNTTLRHCESQSGMDLASAKLKVAASTKQSSFTNKLTRGFQALQKSHFTIRSEQGDCRVARLLQRTRQLCQHVVHQTDAPTQKLKLRTRNDELGDILCRKLFGGVKANLLEGYSQ